jgi:two-component system phosphate regulon sensor histidine kinase PhoR
MNSNVFTKLLGVFLLLLAIQMVVVEFVFHRIWERTPEDALHLLARDAFWSALIALVIALPLAAWFSGRIAARLRRVVTFARRIADGDLAARIDSQGAGEISAVEAALNQTAERLGRDFAELESGRAELAVMLDSMQEGVVAITSSGFVRWSNAVMQRIAGSQLIPGRPLVHSVRDPELLACVRGVLERHELCVGRASLLAPGRVFEVNAAPLPAGGALVVLHDVTSIEAAQKSRREFVANVSHELRTPLNAILGFSEMLGDAELAPRDFAKQREYAKIIYASADHLLSVVNLILDASKIAAGTFRILPEPFSLAPLIADCCAMVRLKAEAGGVALEQAANLDAGELIADKRACRQILLNLIANAVKFTDRGGRVVVGAEAAGETTLITVFDNGVGIPAESLSRLGDPFFQVRADYDRNFEGAGLGLSLVRGLVGLHGGAMKVESVVGVGTRVTVRLPRICQPDEQTGAPAPLETEARLAAGPPASPQATQSMVERKIA